MYVHINVSIVKKPKNTSNSRIIMEGNNIKKVKYIREIIVISCLLLCGFNGLFAQQNTNVVGGSAYGAGGSVSYSIGQMDYVTATGGGGSVTEGLQQPFEILIISGIEESDINLSLAVYPNPTNDFVVLNVQNTNTLDMTYALYNIEGKLIEKQGLNGDQTTIAMKDLANGIYFIKVLRKSTEVKIFKVIKNN